MNLTSKYLGFELKNPFVASASPMTGRLDRLKQLEDGGIAAVVLPSLFEEQVEHEELQAGRLQELGAGTFGEAVGGYFPALDDYNTGPDAYLEFVEQAKSALEIPVIASLNGVSPGGWLSYATEIERAGADALELNIYFIPADPKLTAASVEARYVEIVRAVRDAATIPIAVKLHPYFSAPIDMAVRLTEAGADGLVLFNRFFQPDIDLDTLDVRPDMSLSTSADLRLPLRWTAILRGHISASIATTSGAHSIQDALKLLLAGADAVQMASALMKNGPRHTTALLTELFTWLSERDYESVAQMKGSVSHQNVADPAAFERSNYMAALTSFTSAFDQ